MPRAVQRGGPGAAGPGASVENSTTPRRGHDAGCQGRRRLTRGRRKEVGLGILRTLALLMALGASGPAAIGALSDDPRPADPPEPAPPAPGPTGRPPGDAGMPAP